MPTESKKNENAETKIDVNPPFNIMFFVKIIMGLFVTYFTIIKIKLVLMLIIGVIILSVIYKPLRFYIFSFFFPYLYENRSLSNLLGIKYADDRTFKPERSNTQIYLKGVFAELFKTFITGMPIITPIETRKELMALQGQFAKNITMEHYFEKINKKTMDLCEFEDYLSECILKETNRVFDIVDKKDEEII